MIGKCKKIMPESVRNITFVGKPALLSPTVKSKNSFEACKMPLQEFYQHRVKSFQQKAERLQRSENRLSLGRLITFLMIFGAFFTLRSWSYGLATVVSVSCMILFGLLIRQYARTEYKKDYNRLMTDLNTRELKSITGDQSGFDDGREYIDRNHPYSYDLDLFGKASVFQFLNRTCSLPGARLLAQWLKQPAETLEIRLRQQAVLELKPDIDWRQLFLATGSNTRQSLNNPGELLDWMEHENEFRKPRRLKWMTFVLGALGTGMTAWIVISGQPAALLVPVLVINFLLYFSQVKKIGRLHHQVSRSAGLLETYAGLVLLIEEKEFSAYKLLDLQRHFKTQYRASAAIRELSKQVNRLDTRLNVLVSIPLNLFFFWDIQVCLTLEAWKKRYAAEINRWLTAMAEFEALNSLAGIAFNNPSWAMPEIVAGYFTFQAKNLGHPLIPEDRRILNDLNIPAANRILIITGSNMSGKSTFLRTCGVNAILALAGAPVCASSCSLSNVQVFSSMRISDSLEDNTSSFYAELKRLASIIRQAEEDPKVLLLLDEILRGTNSQDRYTGSVALVRQLAGYGTVALVASHDLKLAGLEKELQGVDNYHFDVKVDGEELYFDYRLTPGICTSLNASILMKKMGIRI
jgi:hypothetical protein